MERESAGNHLIDYTSNSPDIRSVVVYASRSVFSTFGILNIVTYAFVVELAISSSGDTYCAVPTNVPARSDSSFKILPVPKSVIFKRILSSSRRFSGLRSLHGLVSSIT